MHLSGKVSFSGFLVDMYNYCEKLPQIIIVFLKKKDYPQSACMDAA